MRPTIFQRLRAYLLDVLVVYLIVFFISIGHETFLQELFKIPPLFRMEITRMRLESFSFLFFGVFFAYLFYCNYFARGKSFGCLYYNFTVLGKDEKEPTLIQSFIRSVAHASFLLSFSNLLFFALVLIPFFSKSKKSAADYISRLCCFMDKPLVSQSPSLVFVNEEPPPLPEEVLEESLEEKDQDRAA